MQGMHSSVLRARGATHSLILGLNCTVFQIGKHGCQCNAGFTGKGTGAGKHTITRAVRAVSVRSLNAPIIHAASWSPRHERCWSLLAYVCVVHMHVSGTNIFRIGQ